MTSEPGQSDPEESPDPDKSPNGDGPTSDPTPPTRPAASPGQPTHQRAWWVSPAARWTLVFFVVVIALVVAIWPRSSSSDGSQEQIRPSGALSATDLQVDDTQLAQARAEAAIAACPQVDGTATAATMLSGVSAPCLASGQPYNLGAGTVGKPVVINMWAVWCQPCRAELPVLAQYAQRAGDAVTVLTVHAREGANNPYLVLRFLSELGVHLPTVLDTDGQVAAALAAPRVFPSTLILRADGSLAKVAPRVFENPQQIADEVRAATGVAT